MNKNESIPRPNIYATMNAVLRGKCAALSVYIKMLEKSHTSTLKTHIKTIEEKIKSSKNEEEMARNNKTQV